MRRFHKECSFLCHSRHPEIEQDRVGLYQLHVRCLRLRFFMGIWGRNTGEMIHILNIIGPYTLHGRGVVFFKARHRRVKPIMVTCQADERLPIRRISEIAFGMCKGYHHSVHFPRIRPTPWRLLRFLPSPPLNHSSGRRRAPQRRKFSRSSLPKNDVGWHRGNLSLSR